VVVSVRPPSAAAASAARPVFYRDVADFEHHLTTREWAAAIVDIGHFEDRSSHPDGIRPFWRLDVVDQLRRLRTMDERPLLALVRDRYDLAAQLTVAEAAGCTPSLVGAITSLDEVDGAVRELAGDGVSWLAVDRDRVVALQAFLSTLGDEGRRKTGYWMRHLLVAAAAGQPGPQSLAALLHFRMQTVKTWSSRVDRELRKTFDHAPPGYPMTMIAATAQALQPWLWRWTVATAATSSTASSSGCCPTHSDPASPPPLRFGLLLLPSLDNRCSLGMAPQSGASGPAGPSG